MINRAVKPPAANIKNSFNFEAHLAIGFGSVARPYFIPLLKSFQFRMSKNHTGSTNNLVAFSQLPQDRWFLETASHTPDALQDRRLLGEELTVLLLSTEASIPTSSH